MRFVDTAIVAGGALSILGIAVAFAAAIIGVVWIGAVYGTMFLIPVLAGMIFLERLMTAKVVDMKSKAESRPAQPDARADAVEASIRIVIGTTGVVWSVGLIGYLLYQLGQATSWWVVAIVAFLATPLIAVSQLDKQPVLEKAKDGP